MVTKRFSYYHQGDEDAVQRSLTIEAGEGHLAIIKGGEERISDFELFTFDNHDNNFEQSIDEVINQSTILQKDYSGITVFINTPSCVLIPVFKFNKDIAANYLNLAMGEDYNSFTFFDHIAVDPGIMNAFRVSNDWYTAFNERFHHLTFRHSWSPFIRKNLTAASSATTPNKFYLAFYEGFFNITAIKDGQLKLVQSFNFASNEEVLYHLLNTSRQLEVSSHQLSLAISGAIDTDSQLYRELMKHFRQINTNTIETENVDSQMLQQPYHYFTPYFNLVL